MIYADKSFVGFFHFSSPLRILPVLLAWTSFFYELKTLTSMTSTLIIPRFCISLFSSLVAELADIGVEFWYDYWWTEFRVHQRDRPYLRVPAFYASWKTIKIGQVATNQLKGKPCCTVLLTQKKSGNGKMDSGKVYLIKTERIVGKILMKEIEMRRIAVGDCGVRNEVMLD